ncbi:MAG: CPBP family glutamic-type intramembrane protease [Planctomycetota bacterium]
MTDLQDSPRDAAAPMAGARRIARLIEMSILFLIVPVLFAWWRATGDAFQNWLLEVGASEGLAGAFKPQRIMFPTLYAFVIVSLLLLLADRTFANGQLWRMRELKPNLRLILLPWPVALLFIAGFVLLLRPDSLFELPRERPLIWLIIVVFYPWVSVYPQGVLYRSFFFHRYERALPGGRWTLIAAAAFAFGWMHIVFLNWVAPLLCLIAGLKFAHTYERTRSGAAAWFEHAIYGCSVFTVGLGWYFFGGRSPAS